MRYEVRTVSAQINGNHFAWSKFQSAANTIEEANEIASNVWDGICKNADEAGTSYIGETVFVWDTELGEIV